MNEKQTRKEFKEAVISAIHGLSYEESIKKEINNFGCEFVAKISHTKYKEDKEGNYIPIIEDDTDLIEMYGEYSMDCFGHTMYEEEVCKTDYENMFITNIHKDSMGNTSIYVQGEFGKNVVYHNFKDIVHEIIGLPITIGRVIKSLGRDYMVLGDGTICEYSDRFSSEGYNPWIKKTNWKLTKENGIECVDDDQDIKEIEKLLQLLK